MGKSKKEEWKEIFNMVDDSGSGKIPSDKLGYCMRALRTYPTQDDIASYIRESDPKGSGKIDFDALCKHMEKQKPLDMDAATAAFKVFDKSENGTISASDMKHALTSMGEMLTDKEVENFINDAFEDGKLMYNDFLKGCAN
jgi:calmodulin